MTDQVDTPSRKQKAIQIAKAVWAVPGVKSVALTWLIRILGISGPTALIIAGIVEAAGSAL